MKVTPPLSKGFFSRSVDEFKRLSISALTAEGTRRATSPLHLANFHNPESLKTCKVFSDADMGGFSKLLPSSSVKQSVKVSTTPQYPVLDLETFEALLKQHNAASGHPGRLWGLDETETLAQIAYGGLEEEEASGSISTDDVEKLLEFHVEQMQKLGTRMPIEVKSKLKSLLDDSIITPSVAAMLETVSTARENKDMACLNFALNWLYHFGKEHPNIIEGFGSTSMLGVEKEGLAFLRIKAKETGMWTLWSSSLLSEAKLALSNGESVAGAFEGVLKSSHLVTEKGMKSMMGPQNCHAVFLMGRLGLLLQCEGLEADSDLTFEINTLHVDYLIRRADFGAALSKLEQLAVFAKGTWR
ncbi:hypothetical protein DID88_007085 [Monilinia fructigena]|uniref:Anaphase-promoting complex subunit 5 n=1 Tax=Monilinia fructigena TaxID=38457 RepID=A0A395J8A8_9HELO|nr:hypothetical protein DID88_007085 [Monilinia fructigena]